MWQCPNCETANKDESNTCEVCGYKIDKGGRDFATDKTASLKKIKKGFVWTHCPECGTKYYKDYSKHCHKCGKQRK